jgi:hypothetical protein
MLQRIPNSWWSLRDSGYQLAGEQGLQEMELEKPVRLMLGKMVFWQQQTVPTNIGLLL